MRAESDRSQHSTPGVSPPLTRRRLPRRRADPGAAHDGSAARGQPLCRRCSDRLIRAAQLRAEGERRVTPGARADSLSAR